MHCPLCSGPVHHTDDGMFECEVGYRVDGERMSEATELEMVQALWMAIQALDNEADVLRALGGEEGAAFADDAERQGRQLREFARKHSRKLSNPK